MQNCEIFAGLLPDSCRGTIPKMCMHRHTKEKMETQAGAGATVPFIGVPGETNRKKGRTKTNFDIRHQR